LINFYSRNQNNCIVHKEVYRSEKFIICGSFIIKENLLCLPAKGYNFIKYSSADNLSPKNINRPGNKIYQSQESLVLTIGRQNNFIILIVL